MNTPEPCVNCQNLYCNCLYKDDPAYQCECMLGLKMGVACKSFTEKGDELKQKVSDVPIETIW